MLRMARRKKQKRSMFHKDGAWRCGANKTMAALGGGGGVVGLDTCCILEESFSILRDVDCLIFFTSPIVVVVVDEDGSLLDNL